MPRIPDDKNPQTPSDVELDAAMASEPATAGEAFDRDERVRAAHRAASLDVAPAVARSFAGVAPVPDDIGGAFADALRKRLDVKGT
ncbi:MAG TPA: hypothetical protein VIJ22_19380 [Polyangiaceae bacterium]